MIKTDKIKSLKGQAPLETSRFLKNRKSLTGQAAAEMAIFGTLILLCFSVLLTYGQRLDTQQQLKMEAFRKALQKAWERNSSVSYTVEKDHRFFNLMGGFGQGQPSSLSASASVMWQKGASGSQGATKDNSFSFYEINDQMIGSETTGLPRYDKTVTGHDGTPTTSVNVPAGVWKKEIVKKVTGYDSTATKDEADGGVITNIQESDLGETVITRLYTRFDKAETDARETVNVPEYVYADSANNTYEYEGDTITVTPPVNAESSQGAYLDEDNRIKYKEDEVGTIIHKQRSWTTDY